MHIAFWSPAWPLAKYQNGIITYVHWMKHELERKGHRVSVFTNTVDPSCGEPGIHEVRRGVLSRMVRRLKGPGSSPGQDVFDYSSVIAAAIHRVHRRDPIDVIELEESFGWFSEVARRTKIPLLVKLHGPAFLSLVEDELHTPLSVEKIAREGHALKLAGFVASPSLSTLQQTAARYGLSPRVQAHVVNPLLMDADTPLWSLEACDKDTILFVGRFDLRKGADVTLKAFRTALDASPNLKLIFVGPDAGIPDTDGTVVQFEAYRNALFGDAFRDRVEYRGRMPNREIARLRARAMLTVIASRWENQSYALLEAMFQGCPVVSTDSGGCPESVVHEVSGRLARSGDPDSFAREFLAMIGDPAKAASLGRNAREYVLREHSPAQVADASIRLYERLISEAERN
jgi:glycosyltransferase involved in cell wall biosynthesis